MLCAICKWRMGFDDVPGNCYESRFERDWSCSSEPSKNKFDSETDSTIPHANGNFSNIELNIMLYGHVLHAANSSFGTQTVSYFLLQCLMLQHSTGDVHCGTLFCGARHSRLVESPRPVLLVFGAIY